MRQGGRLAAADDVPFHGEQALEVAEERVPEEAVQKPEQEHRGDGPEAEEAVDYTQGPNLVQVHLQTYRDPSSAYEGYTSQLSPGMNPSTVGNNTAIDSEKLLMLVGNFVLEVWGPHGISWR